MPEAVEFMLITARPMELVYADAVLSMPRFVVKLISVLFMGVKFCKTSTVMLALSFTVAWDG
ncbi:Uncharacterised protein [uncultured archaeon]|nr:Uncharacterised protein [uncultured archaeon]